MTREAPPGGYHNDTPTWKAGGTVGDSRKGSRLAGKRHAARMDCNGQISKDGYPINGHGWPWKPKFLGRHGFAHFKRITLLLMIPGLRTSKKTFKQNKRFGIRVTEWEVKAFGPRQSRMPTLVTYMERLKSDAIKVWGDDWDKHLVVKVLTNLHSGDIDGMKYAIRVLKASHRVGIPNMILCRGHWAQVVVNRPYITWNRGGRV